MNRLLTTAPTALTIGGVSFLINADYRTAIKVTNVFADDDLAFAEKLQIVLDLLFGEDEFDDDGNVIKTNKPTENLQETLNQILWFLRCGREVPKDQPKGATIDFDNDDNYLFNALLRKGVDLDISPNMHWWTFSAHIAELPEDCAYSHILYLRGKSRRGDPFTKEEKKEALAIGWDVILPENKEPTDEMLIADYMARRNG